MFKRLLSLQWKSFFRSANLGKDIAIKIVMAFFGVYFIVMFLGLGIALFPMLKKMYPESDPFYVLNGFLFYWFLTDLALRFFFQKLPIMGVKPLLVIPVKRKKIINFVLGKSMLSFFNFLPLFAIVPFGITLMVKAYPVGPVLVWMLSIVVVTLIINFLNFIIESYSAKTELSFLPIIAITSGLYALEYFGIVLFTDIFSKMFNAVYSNPVLVLVPIGVLTVLYLLNFKLLKEKLFLDSGLREEVKAVETSNLNWTKNFGDSAPFMQLDLKLIWRNKRSKSSVWMLVIGLLYGLFFYPNPSFRDTDFFYLFVGIFVTGSFLINFGQFIPAWDSGYYRLLMSQNIKYEQYLKSKFTLMALSVIILFVLSIPYVYFGWKILVAHFAATIYNIGVNTHVILYGGAFNRKAIDLNQKATFNYQGTGAAQWLIGIPLLIVPMILFAIFDFFMGFEIACGIIAFFGIIGVICHTKLMKKIKAKYLDSKYKMINAFSEKN
ncbi:MAG: DUF5687 family protein [Aestuariibaculum sp.]